jgi:hypothetical protein
METIEILGAPAVHSLLGTKPKQMCDHIKLKATSLLYGNRNGVQVSGTIVFSTLYCLQD